MNKIVLITGATSGIGKALARKLAKERINLILVGRREERLLSLKAELEQQKVEAITLTFDVRDYNKANEMLSALPERWKKIDVLVNNAGLALGLSPIQEGDIADWDQMIDTNIKGLLYMTRIVSPWMIERGKGHIVNIGSIAGKEVYANGNVYCATKHAVVALSKAMRIDMLAHNIRVSLVCPGAAETEFSNVRFKGDDERANKVYDGFKPLVADDVADGIIYAINQPAHVDVQEILIMSTAQATGTLFHKK